MSPTNFSAQVREDNQRTVIDLRGEINAQADQALSKAYSEAEDTDTEIIALNFSEVTYINSTGIALIVGLLAQARKSHRKLAVFGLSDHYVHIFQITHLADFMDIYVDEASALKKN
jgi:anti-anti-sigma factor